MKNFLITMFALVNCGSAFAASTNFPINSKSWEKPSQNIKVVNVCNLTNNEWNAILQGNHPDRAVEFSAKTTMPISFFLTGDLVNLVDDEVASKVLEIKQTFYMRCVENQYILSINLIDWKPFLEFITGTTSITADIDQGQPIVSIGAEMNCRNS